MNSDILNKYCLGRLIQSKFTHSFGYINSIIVEITGRIKFTIYWQDGNQSLLYINDDEDIINNNLIFYEDILNITEGKLIYQLEIYKKVHKLENDTLKVL